MRRGEVFRETFLNSPGQLEKPVQITWSLLSKSWTWRGCRPYNPHPFLLFEGPGDLDVTFPHRETLHLLAKKGEHGRDGSDISNDGTRPRRSETCAFRINTLITHQTKEGFRTLD